MLHIIIISMMILNFCLLFFIKKNIYTWYLYHFLGGVLPIVEIILLSKKVYLPNKSQQKNRLELPNQACFTNIKSHATKRQHG